MADGLERVRGLAVDPGLLLGIQPGLRGALVVVAVAVLQLGERGQHRAGLPAVDAEPMAAGGELDAVLRHLRRPRLAGGRDVQGLDLDRPVLDHGLRFEPLADVGVQDDLQLAAGVHGHHALVVRPVLAERGPGGQLAPGRAGLPQADLRPGAAHVPVLQADPVDLPGRRVADHHPGAGRVIGGAEPDGAAGSRAGHGRGQAELAPRPRLVVVAVEDRAESADLRRLRGGQQGELGGGADRHRRRMGDVQRHGTPGAGPQRQDPPPGRQGHAQLRTRGHHPPVDLHHARIGEHQLVAVDARQQRRGGPGALGHHVPAGRYLDGGGRGALVDRRDGPVHDVRGDSGAVVDPGAGRGRRGVGSRGDRGPGVDRAEHRRAGVHPGRGVEHPVIGTYGRAGAVAEPEHLQQPVDLQGRAGHPGHRRGKHPVIGEVPVRQAPDQVVTHDHPARADRVQQLRHRGEVAGQQGRLDQPQGGGEPGHVTEVAVRLGLHHRMFDQQVRDAVRTEETPGGGHLVVVVQGQHQHLAGPGVGVDVLGDVPPLLRHPDVHRRLGRPFVRHHPAGVQRIRVGEHQQYGDGRRRVRERSPAAGHPADAGSHPFDGDREHHPEERHQQLTELAHRLPEQPEPGCVQIQEQVEPGHRRAQALGQEHEDQDHHEQA